MIYKSYKNQVINWRGLEKQFGLVIKTSINLLNILQQEELR